MKEAPFISICIPVYKNIQFLERLFGSIVIQTFRDYEVVVTDDSPDDTVAAFIGAYQDKLRIRYFRNQPSLGTPANWNSAIRRAEGEWIKLMHDDDWFDGPGSLARFAEAARSGNADFIFSGFYLVREGVSSRKRCVISPAESMLLRANPNNLLRKNFIGHPSTTMIRNDGTSAYDERFKWVVDIEYYTRYLRSGRSWKALREPLVNIGLGSHQVTKTVFRNPAVEIPENIAFLKILTPAALKNLFVYDYYWRFIRNLGVKSVKEIAPYFSPAEVPEILFKMITQHAHYPDRLMRMGLFSKMTMIFSYVWNRIKGNLS